ncbi:MAG: Mov34/MPN/PAD-1 family protein [Pseudomonadota bacterium]
MSVYRQTGAAACEAGGVLLGSLRGPHMEVLGCSEPMGQDRRTRFLFDRRDPGHVSMVRAAMAKSGGTVGYIGEWHTHPEPTPTPSGQDERNWRGLLRQAGHRLAFVILGTEGLYVRDGW